MLKNLSIITIIFSTSLIFGCKKDSASGPFTPPSFSADTLLFDTVFTTVGSTTQWLKVYNTNKYSMVLTSIEIAGGSSSFYRMNVDGIATYKATNVEIAAGDSLYIFVEVTIDPNSVNSPLIATDSIMFYSEGETRHVDLVAWGQDAYFYGSVGSAYYLTCNDIWLNDKPHVIYGYAFVDTSCSLTIQAGTQIYMHEGSALITLKNSKLTVNGQYGNEVVIQGDRLESYYSEVPGQWGFIQLIQNNNSTIDWAVIKNGNVGLVVDSTDVTGTNNLTISNTIVQDMASIGILTRLGCEMQATNSLFSDCGEYTAGITSGGSVNFTHCTFSNFWDFSVRQTPLMVLNNWIETTSGTIIYPTNYNFKNCIMYGNIANEFTVDTLTGVTNNFLFENCLLKSTDETFTSTSHYLNCTINPSSVFVDGYNKNFRLFVGSPARDSGNPAYSVSPDLDNTGRWDGFPDMGCYEL